LLFHSDARLLGRLESLADCLSRLRCNFLGLGLDWFDCGFLDDESLLRFGLGDFLLLDSLRFLGNNLLSGRFPHWFSFYDRFRR